ncbi:MAG: sigma-70 family RNA polymerase sigma factor [Armatimonadota bacterium]|nr:sigma-70 family RNA polymerase sigma factor [Armatimonadota bacterium]
MQDWPLLREYVEDGSQAAFARLVERYSNLVYSTCLRELRNPSLAEDVTQVVFILLAKKARQMNEGVVLSGWLFNTARYASKNALKQEARRQYREYKAAEAMMQASATKDVSWEQLEPFVHDAMARLSQQDQNAVLLRFFEGKSLKETGAALGISEEAARKRVARALDKLRRYLARQGFAVPALVLAALLSRNAVEAAPPTCIASVLRIVSSLTSGGGATGATSGLASSYVLTLSDEVLRTLFFNRVKTAAAVLVGVILLGMGANSLWRGAGTHSPGNPASVATKTAGPAVASKNASVQSDVGDESTSVLAEATSAGEGGTVLEEQGVQNSVTPKSALRSRKSRQKLALLRVSRQQSSASESTSSSWSGESAWRQRASRQKFAGAGRPRPAQVGPTRLSAVTSRIATRTAVSVSQPATETPRQPEVLAPAADTGANDSQAPPAADEGQTGTVTGILTAQGDNWIEVKADGAGHSTRFFAHANGDAPGDADDLDKNAAATIKELIVPNRVRLEWQMAGKPRLRNVEMVVPEERSGTTTGTVTAKGESWIEVRDAAGSVDRYMPLWNVGPDRDTVRAIAQTNVGDEVTLEWTYGDVKTIVQISASQ